MLLLYCRVAGEGSRLSILLRLCVIRVCSCACAHAVARCACAWLTGSLVQSDVKAKRLLRFSRVNQFLRRLLRKLGLAAHDSNVQGAVECVARKLGQLLWSHRVDQAQLQGQVKELTASLDACRRSERELADVVGVHAGGRARLMHLYCSLQARYMHDIAALALMGGSAGSGTASLIDGLWTEDSSVTLAGGAPASPGPSGSHSTGIAGPSGARGSGPEAVTGGGSFATAPALHVLPAQPAHRDRTPVMDLSG